MQHFQFQLMQVRPESKIVDAIAEIGAVLVRSQSLPGMLQDCADLLVKHLDAAVVRIWLIENDAAMLALKASAGCDSRIDARYSRIPIGELKMGGIARNRRAEFTNDIASDPVLSMSDWVQLESIVSFAGHPMLVAGELVGVVGTFARQPFENHDLKLLQAVSDIIATAVEHRLSEEELLQSQRELVAFFENPVVALHSVDADGIIRRANQAELEMLGFSAEEYVGKHLRDFHADREVAENLIRRLSANEVVRDFSARLVCKDGSIKHVLIDSDAVARNGQFAYSRCFSRDVTESTVARGHLERARQLFRAVFDQTFNFIGVLSLEGILLDANQTALNVIGAKLEDVLGQYFWDTAWWAHDPPVQQRLKLAVAGSARGEIHRFEVEHVNRSTGQIIHVDFSLKPVRDSSGAVVLLIPEGRDITERKKAEREILENEARTRAIVDTAPDGIMTITSDGIIASANAPMHRLFGYNHQELLGMPVDVVINSLLELKNSATEGGVTESVVSSKISGLRQETTGRMKDGSIIPVEVSLSELVLSDKLVVIAIVADISERLKSQSWQARFAALVESCEDAIYGKTPGGIITSWNPAAERLYGWSANEAIGKSIIMLFPAGRLYELDELLLRVGSGEKVQNLETVRVTKDGRLIDVALTISPIRDIHRNVSGVSIIARDISLKKAGEKRVSEFYSMVSHELRTPLTSIRASLGLLEGGIAGELPDDAVHLVQIARSESDRLIRLINDILDLRKIEAGKVELRVENIQTMELLRRVCDGLKGMADEARVQISWQLNRGTELRCDKDRIIQVLTNLCSNAIKYSPPNESISIVVDSRDRGLIRFSVCDRGPGIQPEYMHKLFGKFQQIDSSDSRPKGGTGLGLAIVKAIVEQHAGNVGVESIPGKGSTFWFEIPGGAEDNSENPGGEIFILTADPKLSLTLEKLLTADGYQVTCARSVREAEKYFKLSIPNVILIDIQLSDPDGMAQVRRIRKKQLMAEVPVVVLSHRASDSMAVAPCLVDWMIKPFDSSVLKRSIRRAIRRSSGKPLRVLLVEDDHATAAIIRKLLRSSDIECSWAPDGRTALTLVRSTNPDMIVLDIGVPPPDGFDLVRILRKEGLDSLPLLVYTGRDLDSSEKLDLTLGQTMHLVKSKVGQDEFVDSVRLLLGCLPLRRGEPLSQ